MRTFVICLSLALIAYAAASAIPEYDGPVYDLAPVEEKRADTDVPDGPRTRRLTCDVLSFSSQWFTPNHMACATKCVFQGRRGGTCSNGVCVCRSG